MAGRITVVGAGVLGLSCAVRLAERGYDVDVLARDLPAETTSAVMGGLWLPHPAEPAAEATRWARTTLVELLALAADPSAGVRPADGHLLHARPEPPPGWAPAVEDLVSPQAVADPAPGYPFGYRVTLPLVDTLTYLPYLRKRLTQAGGTVTRLPLAALPPRGLVVNCTGLSARALVPDPTVHPVRGQVVLLSDPGLSQWCCDTGSGGRPLYVLPRGRDVVVGGIAEDGQWDLTPDLLLAGRLVERARVAVPRLARARVLGHRVGLCPARPTVRLEVEHRPTDTDPGHAVVHCYGHGGNGLTLSWGCAEDVAAAVRSLAGVR
jgi:D-amino-acid oxidase